MGWQRGSLHPVSPTVGLSAPQLQTPVLPKKLGQCGLVLWASEKAILQNVDPKPGQREIVTSFPRCKQLPGSPGMWLRVSTRRVLAELCPSRSPLEDDSSYPLSLFLQYKHDHGCPSLCRWLESKEEKKKKEEKEGGRRKEKEDDDLNLSLEFTGISHIPSHIRARHPRWLLPMTFSCCSFVCFSLERVTLWEVWGCTEGLQGLGAQES